MDETNAACSQCGVFSRVHRYVYAYGLARRGINPRTLVEDDRLLGRDDVLLCSDCRHTIFRSALRRLLQRHAGLLAVPALAVLAIFVGWSLADPHRLRSDTVTALCAAGASLLWFVLGWLWRREKAIREAVFELRREALAKVHGCDPSELRLH